MIDWNDCTPLTREEFDVFISAAIPFLKRMEDKNGWDFFVNDMSIGHFCERFIIEAFYLNDYENYQKYNAKVKDMLAMYHILIKADWSEENATLRKDKGSEIWRLILNKVNAIADTVL
jgi:hypothetical protein